MASIQLNKDVTIVWRDGINYKIRKGEVIEVPNTLVDYIISSVMYQGSVISFSKDSDEKLELELELELEKEYSNSDNEFVSEIQSKDVTVDIDCEKEEEIEVLSEFSQLSQEDEDKEQLELLKKLMEENNKPSPVKRRGRPPKKKE